MVWIDKNKEALHYELQQTISQIRALCKNGTLHPLKNKELVSEYLTLLLDAQELCDVIERNMLGISHKENAECTKNEHDFMYYLGKYSYKFFRALFPKQEQFKYNKEIKSHH